MTQKKGITDEEVIQALKEAGTVKGAAQLLGCHHANIVRRRQKLVMRGLWELDDCGVVPEPYYVKGKTVAYNRTGNKILTWVKSAVEVDKIKEACDAILSAFKEEMPILPAVPDINTPTNADLLNCFILTDFHLGMKAWHEETGSDDWDLQIAEGFLIRWMDYAIKHMPEAEIAVLAQLGDFLHWDGMEAVTPTSKHVLDADTRFQKVVRVAVRLTRYVISSLLQKHKQVVVIQTGGNHDPASTVWLRELMQVAYEGDERVIIKDGAGLYFAYEHGNTSLFFHHGHKRRGNKLGETIIGMFRELFGRTKYSYVHTGHMHNNDVKETVMIIEQHRTMAPKDAYAAESGYTSGRDAKIITYSKQFGEVGRMTVTPEMVKR